jgi:hypothetical protein
LRVELEVSGGAIGSDLVALLFYAIFYLRFDFLAADFLLADFLFVVFLLVFFAVVVPDGLTTAMSLVAMGEPRPVQASQPGPALKPTGVPV